jgi:chloramphenicol-sensitive protein RarD
VTTPPPSRDERARGLLAALAAYLAWGLLPLYFKSIREVPPLEILSHRIVWSLLLLSALVAVTGGARAFRAAFRRDLLPTLAATTALISVNWGTYIWAVNSGHVVDASLGYFLNPLVTVLLGVVFLRETLSRAQRVAIGLAAAGVLVLVVRAGTFPGVALVLATSFGLYGLVRKRARLDALGGLLAETALLAPLALFFLLWRASDGTGAFGTALRPTLLLAAAGVVTALPLIWFTQGVHRLRLSTLGLVQYVAPTGQFLLAVLVYREPFHAAHAVAFALIWGSLAIYTWDTIARVRASERAAGRADASPPAVVQRIVRGTRPR